MDGYYSRIPDPDHFQNRFQTALFQLMKTMPLEAITIDQLCRKADLPRPVFHRFFHCPADILGFYFSCQYEQYQQQTWRLDACAYEQIHDTFFSFWSQRQPQLEIIQKSAGKGMISCNILQFCQQAQSHGTQNQYSWFALYTIGGLCAVLEDILARGESISDKKTILTMEMEQVFQGGRL